MPVYHPDVRVWEVNDAQGKLVGLWYFDPYARKGKRSGAWMNAYRSQERFDGDVKTIVSNNSNFVKGKPGEPVLISWEDAETLFHEFGHALHGLSSNVNYPSVAGTSRAARLRRVPVAAARALAVDAGDPQPVRAALPDGQADPARAGGEDRGGRQVQPGLRYGRIPVERAGRHEAAPRRRPEDRCGQVRARDAGCARHAGRDRHASSHAAVQPRVLERRILGGLLQLPVVGHDHRRCLGGIHRSRRRVGQGRGQAPEGQLLSIGNTVDPAIAYRAVPRPRPGHRAR